MPRHKRSAKGIKKLLRKLASTKKRKQPKNSTRVTRKPNTARQRYLDGKLIHEGYYSDEGRAKREAKKHNGYVKYIRHGLYAGSYEVFAPVPLKFRLKKLAKIKD